MVLFLMAASFAVGLEGLLASKVKNRCPADVGRALRTVGVFGHAVPAILNVSALAQQDGPIGVGVFDRVVIKDLTVILTLSNFATALCLGLHGEAIF